jgi:hypothetical protein
MSHVNATATGAIVVAATQLSQYWEARVINAGATTFFTYLQNRGAPRLLVYASQTAGAAGATVSVQASISDANAVQTLIPLEVSATVLPPGVPTVIPVAVVPSKFIRLAVTAPAGNAVTVELALMVSQ